jgi:hypothetical protein
VLYISKGGCLTGGGGGGVAGRNEKRAPLTTAALDEWIRDVGEDKSEKIKCPAVEKGVE